MHERIIRKVWLLLVFLALFSCRTEEIISSDFVQQNQGYSNKSLWKEDEVFIKNESTFDDINNFLRKGIPVIIDWFAGVKLDDEDVSEGFVYDTKLPTDVGVPNGHSSIVVGLDDAYIYLIDPEIAEIRKIRKEDFIRVWFDFRNPYIMNWEEMILRQIFVILPKK